jgi:hypothetical protein
MTKTVVTTAQARNWLVAHPKTLARLSPKAQATVVPDENGNFPKGRLAAEAINLHNKSNPKAVYVLGQTARVAKEADKAAKAARKAAARKASRKGVTIGQRGPLPKAFSQTVSKG